ncbi:MraY family glycosyltransferase [Lysobacter solisilvae (ex Woo and Kim 2020)]|uniref:Glycosyltransferase family 4 protein n=1 Tax=Agrilutibacter terrestris TaxID=2865112 RepID=A0A7H0FX80_9GAMM|nr:glycosyltransferase family 4 protein [Lysobacter terrestris]QNP40646.1 glycosyltransferase family 4 protein [Lysobacter terrestris]
MVFWLLLHFVIALAGTWMARQYAIRRDLIDHPGERRSHDVPTPRGGGVAIVIALLVAACVLAWRQPQQIVLVAGFAVGLLLVAGIGMVDDHRPLSPWLRLGVQAVAAALFSVAVAATWGNVPLAMLAFAAVLVLTNVWNFMDGINGIAATQAALVGLGLAFVLGGVWGWLALALVAACLGFLPFNFPRARIFLGDVGSGALGFALAALLTISMAGASALPQGLILLPFSAFLIDSGLTLLRRFVRGERWWTAHAQHAYQRWVAAGRTHTVVTVAYAAWTVAAWLLVWRLTLMSEQQMTIWCMLWFAATVGVWAWLQYLHQPLDGPRAAANGKDTE